jgi:phosphatidylglycerophosphate synthase
MTENIDRIVVLADHTASFVVAGLTQLERVLRDLDRWVDGRSDATPVPEIVVSWRPRALLDRQPAFAGPAPMRMKWRHVAAEDEDATRLADERGAGRTITLGTNVVWAPGGLGEQLSSLAAGLPTAARAAGVLCRPEDVARVEPALFRSLGKPSDGYVTRLINRRMSTWVSRRLARTRVTPNHVSLLVMALFLASAWSLVHGTYWMFLLGTCFYKLGDILDGCDGELARVKFMDTRFGAWLDTTIDMCGNMLFLVALAAGLSRQSGLADIERQRYLSQGLLTVGVMAAVILAFARYTRATSGAAHFAGFGLSLAGKSQGRSVGPRLILVLAGLLRRDLYSWLFVGAALAGRPLWILHFAAAFVGVHVPILAYAWWQHWRSVASASDAAGSRFPWRRTPGAAQLRQHLAVGRFQPEEPPGQ